LSHRQECLCHRWAVLGRRNEAQKLRKTGGTDILVCAALQRIGGPGVGEEAVEIGAHVLLRGASGHHFDEDDIVGGLAAAHRGVQKDDGIGDGVIAAGIELAVVSVARISVPGGR
jgi:hypothetical protein